MSSLPCTWYEAALIAHAHRQDGCDQVRSSEGWSRCFAADVGVSVRFDHSYQALIACRRGGRAQAEDFPKLFGGLHWEVRSERTDNRRELFQEIRRLMDLMEWDAAFEKALAVPKESWSHSEVHLAKIAKRIRDRAAQSGKTEAICAPYIGLGRTMHFGCFEATRWWMGWGSEVLCIELHAWLAQNYELCKDGKVLAIISFERHIWLGAETLAFT